MRKKKEKKRGGETRHPETKAGQKPPSRLRSLVSFRDGHQWSDLQPDTESTQAAAVQQPIRYHSNPQATLDTKGVLSSMLLPTLHAVPVLFLCALYPNVHQVVSQSTHGLTG